MVFALAALALGCDRGPGKSGVPGAVPLTDAQAVEAAWKRWLECGAAGDGSGAWSCLSKRSRAERSALFRADAERIKGLSGAALNNEAREWGVSGAAIQGLDAEGLGALALGRELRRQRRAAGAPGSRFAGVDIKGDLAIARVTATEGEAEILAFVREEGTWRLDDLESRRAAGGPK